MTPEKLTPPRTPAKADPILLELWEIKRQINTEAQFDIAKLAKQANQFDIAQALKDLGAVH
jgi:hypothetical protein